MPGTWQRFAKIIRPIPLIALTAAALQPVLTPNVPAVHKGETPFLTAREYPVNAGTRYLRAEAANTVKELEEDAIVFVEMCELKPR